MGVAANRAFERKNYAHENTGAGYNFRSTNAKCESIPKPQYLSGIVAYGDDQTAISQMDFAKIHFVVLNLFSIILISK
jgi:hypothetical protein